MISITKVQHGEERVENITVTVFIDKIIYSGQNGEAKYRESNIEFVCPSVASLFNRFDAPTTIVYIH